MAERMVNCSKLGAQLVGLSDAPFGGELGKEIFEKVSAQAWKEWQDDMMIKIINEYRLDMTDEAQYNILIDQMKIFLGLDTKKPGLEVGDSQRGMGTKKSGGGCCGGGCS